MGYASIVMSKLCGGEGGLLGFRGWCRVVCGLVWGGWAAS